MHTAILFSLLALAAGQSSLSLAAQGGVGNNAATSTAQGTGEEVTGSLEISSDESSTSSTGSITATSSNTAAPTPIPTPPNPTPAQAPVSTPATATATAITSATVSNIATATVAATASATPAANVDVSVLATTSPAPAPMVYYKKMKEEKPEPTCADIKNNTCPAMTEFKNCGYCILQKYPLVGYGCPVEKMLVKKLGTEGEYEVVTKPMCDCPKDALYIDKSTYCPSCNLALTELVVCSGYDKIPKDISKIEIVASCLEKVMVSVKYLEQCGFIKPAPTPIVLNVEKKEDKKDPKKYTMVKPKEVSPHVIVIDPVVKGPKPVPASTHILVPVPVPAPVTPVPAPVPASATPVPAVVTATASATASIN